MAESISAIINKNNGARTVSCVTGFVTATLSHLDPMTLCVCLTKMLSIHLPIFLKIPICFDLWAIAPRSHVSNAFAKFVYIYNKSL